MPTGSSRRLGASLLLMFFALFLGEGLVLSRCPMHEGGAAAGGHAAHGTSHHDPAPEPTAPDACHCLGACVGSVAVTLAAAATLPHTSLVPVAEQVPLRTAHAASHAGQTRLPWANAPPTIA